MYTKVFAQIEQSLAYADFKDADVEKQTKRLLAVLDGELNEAGFEENSPIEDAMEDLKQAIEDADPIENDDDDDENEDEDDNEEDDDDDDDEEDDDEEIEEDDEDD